MRKSLTIEARSRADYVSLLEESLGRLVETLSALDGAERVSLFGSCARRREDLFKASGRAGCHEGRGTVC